MHVLLRGAKTWQLCGWDSALVRQPTGRRGLGAYEAWASWRQRRRWIALHTWRGAFGRRWRVGVSMAHEQQEEGASHKWSFRYKGGGTYVCRRLWSAGSCHRARHHMAGSTHRCGPQS